MSDTRSRSLLERSSWVAPVAGGLLGGLAMTICLGPSLVNPANYEWLMHADYALHFLGWHLFRHGPWTWPLGATPLLIWPIGSSVGLTDSIPVAAILLKPFDPLLPPVFQFIGLWLVLCFALQGVFAVLLMRLATPRASLQLLGALLFIMSPPLVYRIVHAALTAHWLLLAALWLTLRDPAPAGVGRSKGGIVLPGLPDLALLASWIALAALAATIQPYLLLMVMVLMVADHVRHAVAAPSRVIGSAVSGGLAIAAAVVGLWQSGSLMVPSEAGLAIGGFGAWSTNLLSLVMPTEGKTLLAPGPFAYAHGEQYEGYAYLGGGVVLLGGVVVATGVFRIRSWRWSRQAWCHLPLIAALLFLAAMALGPSITWGSRTIFRYDVSWWGPLSIFRTNGRMIWPVYYAVVAAILFVVSRFPPRRAVTLCAIAVILQAIDLAGMTRYVRDVGTYGFRDPLTSRFWSVAPAHYQRLVLIPTNLCTREGYIDHLPFSLLAGRYKLAINAGVTSRYDVLASVEYCKALSDEIQQGLPSDDALYIVRSDLLHDLTKRSREGAVCTVIDGYGVCFSPDSHARWRDTFDLLRSRLPPTEEFGRFYTALNDVYRTTLRRPQREAAGTVEARLEGVVRYLAFRMEGCDHQEAETRVMGSAPPLAGRTFCTALAPGHGLPPADQTLAFMTRFTATLRSTAGGSTATHVDPEGEAVWLQAYAGERAKGVREQDARAAVLDAVRAAAR